MTEAEARELVETLVPRETLELLERYVELLRLASTAQNLVSAATIGVLWQRHILDCVQLGSLVRGSVADVGSGAGLPGIVIAAMRIPVALIEPRRLRSSFLADVVTRLGLTDVAILAQPVSSVPARYDTITARAVAPLDRLLVMTAHLAKPTSRWVLPKGRAVHEELEVARRAWHGRFELVQSITDPSAMIVVAEQLRPRAKQ